MSRPMCPMCTNDDEVTTLEVLPDGRKRARCAACKFEWDHGEVKEPKKLQIMSEVEARGRFPKASDVDPEVMERAEMLKARFLAEVRPRPDPRIPIFWAKYQQVFSAEGLPTCDLEELKDFANDPTGVYVGKMTVFNNAWNALGAAEASKQTRQVIDYLLRGTDRSLEERLTALINGEFAFSIAGLKEALLTKVLSIMDPNRFLTIVTYEQKAAMARAVYGLELPPQDRIAWTIGRLAVWSNDLLNELTGDGFADRPHAGAFLWWASEELA